MTVSHAKVSTIADDPAAAAAGEILPSDWNAGHVVTGLSAVGHTHAGEEIVSGTVADARVAASLARDSEVAAEAVARDAAIAVHAAAADPHPGYLTGAEGAASFDALGSAAAAQAAAIAASQPVDADLTAIAALTTTAFGRSLLTLADQAALLAAAGASAAGHDHAASYQPLDSDLTAIAALATTAFGRSLLAAADAAALRTLAGTTIGTDVPAQGAFDDHSARHENGGADEISVAGLSGALADPQTPAAHAGTHANGGSDAVLPATVSQAEAEAGTGTSTRLWTPQRVAQAIAALGGGGAEHAAYADLAAMLEPLALEPVRRSSGAGLFVAASATKKLVISMWNCQLWSSAWHGIAGAQDRIDVREPRAPFAVKNIGIYAPGANSLLAMLDTSLPDYAGAARAVYFDRLAAIRNADTKYWSIGAASSLLPLLPGPYGSIITGVFTNDTVWAGISPPASPVGTALPIHNHIGDSVGDGERHGFGLLLPVNRNMMKGLVTSIADGDTQISAGITFFNCPANWSAVQDTNTYIDRAEFLEDALDTVSGYTRVQSATDNVEIMSPGAFCRVKGNNSWGANGFYRQAAWNLAEGRVIEWDMLVPTVTPYVIAGASNGGGHATANFRCGVEFTNDGVGTLQIWEDGVSRGLVGSGYSGNVLYRVRITLHAGGSATYEIQGGPEYPAIGGPTWTDITPGTSSFATTGFHLAASTGADVANLIADMKVYDP